MLLIDLDELPRLRALKTFGIGRLALFGFDPARHGDGSDRPLKAQVEGHLAAAGLACGGPIRVLAMPQILGRSFNPLTVYFCHGHDGDLSAVLYEVNNTFGERHSYLIPAPEGAGRAAMLRQACAKEFYVSPFMDMDLSYAFRILRPDERVMVAVDVSDAEGLLLSASFMGERRALSDRALLKAWISHPWMTLGVLAAIQIEALKIWLKGGKVRVRPPPPPQAVTVTPQAKLAA
jgi:DUF1365 family protein